MTPRENPFAAARFAPGVLPWIGDIEALVDRTCVPGARLQIVGPQGSGKSTLLVHLARRAEMRGWSTRSFRGSQGLEPALFSARSCGPLAVFADEVEELGALRFALLRALCALRRAALVVTAHRDLGMETLTERTADAETVQELCHRLLAGRADTPSCSELEELLRRHRGNVREVFFDLYDALAAR